MTYQSDTNKNNIYLSSLTQPSSGNVNIYKILYKIRDGRKTSSEKIWVNTIEYIIMHIQYKNIKFNNGTI